MHLPERLKRFLLGGSSAFVVNAALLILLVEALRFHSPLLKNIANVIAMELSIFYHFLFSRMWTWQDAPKKHRERLAAQFIAFNVAALAGVLIRIVSFAAMENVQVHYLLNLTIGVAMAALLDFILYDRLVFRRTVPARSKPCPPPER